MTYVIVTEETQENIRGPYPRVMQRMYQLNSLGVCHIVQAIITTEYGKEGRTLPRPRWLSEDWHRCRMMDAMAQD